MKTKSLKLIAAIVLMAACTTTQSQAREWPTHFQNPYVNNHQQVILIRQDIAARLGLAQGKLVRFNGVPKYFMGWYGQGSVSGNGPVYYPCLFDDWNPQARSTSTPSGPPSGFRLFNRTHWVKNGTNMLADVKANHHPRCPGCGH